MKDVGGAVLAGSTPPFLGRERAAVDVDVGPERRSPRYHETCLALESVEESSAMVLEPRCVWLRVLIFKDLRGCLRHRCSVSLLNKSGWPRRSGAPVAPPLFPVAPFRRLGSLFLMPSLIEPN